ncbi:TldD/PmbA family protein [Phaeobacter gallaeciensis]|uniref:TldD/PmbA family protein n=1 Tax=Phaeobacter gallaeciensis TaxID=60890 RepID=UPI00237F3DB8|nr:TldD/PmbA family protein [Phaeobacter gallaeciensis]MDE4141529.1 TldD/PmbA family protein [Phaeobacter gallaeciensis]MDE4149974.1 TldD/PmbA family protein [Phaeobacter gallaeciensis]MDE4154200.1 TldD/PmbA family protein [Phaeobacter gallaeciensis]MDE4229631.1 TldD/PmbA family protein [Phaeobacter gallaeciensis]MDE4258666.1 TldD/PmbA family protein [Phaeobacter gallaeciensis]
MTQTPETLCHALIDAARKAGADAADAMAAAGSSLSIEVREGRLEHAERSEGTDLGLRVFLGQRQALVSSSDSRPETIAAMAERAVAMAREAPEDPYTGLAAPDQLAQDWDLAALDLNDPTADPAPAALQEDALAAEAACQAIDGISQVQSAGAGYGRSSVYLATSNGFSGGDTRTGRSISCTGIAGTGTGMERDYDGDSRTYQSDLRSAEEIGRSAGERTVARMNARRPKTGTYPVLFDERISASLIGHLLSAVNGAAIARGSSWLQDSLGQQVLPKHLSVIEDPHRPRIAGSRPFDGEGLATRRRAIVEDGTLTGWTLDLASARKLGMESTANAARGIGSVPSPSNWNVALTQGDQSRADLIAGMGTGLLVTSLIGSTINPNTGDYSRGASGFWVENGEIAYPVNECTIAGNLRDMLMRIVPANDARSYLSRVVPSLLVEGMTLAGN